jgi:8-oxo-dGTP diphosphatase
VAGPETPKLMVDVVIPSERGVVLIRRGSEPFKGKWALPGGFVEVGETVEEAADRETAEETSLVVEVARLVGVYSDPERDPRGHNVSVAFLVRVFSGQLAAASDAADIAVLDPASVELAFDHSKIIEDALSLDSAMGRVGTLPYQERFSALALTGFASQHFSSELSISRFERGEQVVEGLGEGWVGEHTVPQLGVWHPAHHRYLEHGGYLAAF